MQDELKLPVATFGEQVMEQLKAMQTKHGAKLTATECAEVIDELFQKAVKTHAPKGKRVLRNTLFEAFVKEMKLGGPEGEVTDAMGGSIATAVTGILKVSPDATPEEVCLRIKLYRKRHPTQDFGPMAICKNWTTLRGRAPLPSENVYREPPNWRTVAHKISPALLERDWRDICISYGPQILKLLQQQ